MTTRRIRILNRPGAVHLSLILQSGLAKLDLPKYMSYASQTGNSGRYLLQLIDTKLDYSKSAPNNIDFHPETVDMEAVIHELTDMLQTKCESRGVVIAVAVAADVRLVQADPLRLRQVLLSLIDNAVKFSGEGGQVAVRVRLKGAAECCVEVEDHGIGIAASDLSTLFVQFNQLSTGNTKTHGGTGMGLALVRRRVKSQGGRVGVRSTLGAGSVFHIILPFDSPTPPPFVAP